MEYNSVEYDFAKIRLDDDGITHIKYVPNAVVTIVEAKQILAALQKVNQGKKRPLFTDARGLKNINREARVFWESEEVAALISATATHNTPLINMLAALFVKLNQPPFPIKFFSSEAEGIAWLKRFLD